jgi:hypothetical protein
MPLHAPKLDDRHLQNCRVLPGRSDLLERLEREGLAFVQVDGDDSFIGCREALEAASRSLKPGALLVLPNYASDRAAAVNHFCLSHDFEIVYLVFQRGEHDVAIRRMAT